jgi:release factor glutamine methyltransferase
MGYKEFWGLRFDLNDHTLDPRPETEILVEHVLNWVSENDLQNKPIRILDLGTGTGCIPITLLTELPAATAIAADLSQDALDMAQQNAARHDVAGRIAFQKSNWFSNIDGQFDVIVSNPPYIDSNDVPNLHPDVQNHDPILALDGGKNGIEPYEIIFSSLKNFLKPGGAAFFEIGAEQCGYITRLSEKTMSRIEAIYPDLAGIPRVVQITCGDK